MNKHHSAIYTRTGDLGETSLGNGTRVSKDEMRIEVLGMLDELNAYIGYIKTFNKFHDILENIQQQLIAVGAELSLAKKKQLNLSAAILFLEQKIDELDANLKTQRSFAIPGKNTPSSIAHIARTICRRFERRLVTLSKNEPINPDILKYTNRLSDFLFVIAETL